MTPEQLEVRAGTGFRILVDETVHEIKTVHPLVESQSVHDNTGDASDVLLQPTPDGGIDGKDYPEVEIQFVSPDHPHAVLVADHPNPEQVAPDVNKLAMERDLALRQARYAEAGLTVIRMALNENRPLEALHTVNNELKRLDDELAGLEQLGEQGGD